MNAQIKEHEAEIQTPTPTQTVYSELSAAYDFFNERLFDGELPPCILSIHRIRGAYGAFAHNRFVDRTRPDLYTHELSMHPGYFAVRTSKDILSTLVHEMVHLQCALRRQPGEHHTPGYHDKAWGNLMEAVGLMPSATGRPGGKKLGFRMSHYVMDGGRFEVVVEELLDSGWSLTWLDRFTERTPATTPGESDDDEDDDDGLHDPGGTQGIQGGKKKSKSEIDEVLGLTDPKVLATLQPRKSGSMSGKRTKYQCQGCSANVWGKADLNIICGGCEQPFKAEKEEP